MRVHQVKELEDWHVSRKECEVTGTSLSDLANTFMKGIHTEFSEPNAPHHLEKKLRSGMRAILEKQRSKGAQYQSI